MYYVICQMSIIYFKKIIGDQNQPKSKVKYYH